MSLIFLQFIQEPVHGILDGRKSIMCSMNVVGVILLTVAIYTIQAGNNNSDYTIRYSLSLCSVKSVKFFKYLSTFQRILISLEQRDLSLARMDLQLPIKRSVWLPARILSFR